MGAHRRRGLGSPHGGHPYKECDPTRRSCAEALSHSEFVSEQILGMAITAGGIGAYRGEDTWTRVEGVPLTALVAPSFGGIALGARITF